MAEKAEKKEKRPEAPPAAPAEKSDAKKGAAGGLLTKMPVLLGGAMIIEAVVLFAGFKFLGSGAHPAAAATELTTTSHEGGGEKGEAGEKGEGKPAAKKGKTAEVD